MLALLFFCRQTDRFSIDEDFFMPTENQSTNNGIENTHMVSNPNAKSQESFYSYRPPTKLSMTTKSNQTDTTSVRSPSSMTNQKMGSQSSLKSVISLKEQISSNNAKTEEKSLINNDDFDKTRATKIIKGIPQTTV